MTQAITPFQSAPSCEGEPIVPHDAFSPRSVSIRALVRGRTSVDYLPFPVGNGFNPRPRARANRRHMRTQVRPQVSIRALVRGRTHKSLTDESPPVFQSAPSCEGEPRSPTATNHSPTFQSAPSCEGEPLRSGARHGGQSFNPRPRARANFPRGFWGLAWRRFNPRPRARANNFASRDKFW